MSEDRSILGQALDWYGRGGVAGSLGMAPVDQQILAAAAKEPVAGSLAQRVLPVGNNPLMNWLAPGNMTRPVYHGTAQNFDKFSNESVGSGQGAQSYGWGHYVAGAKETGEHYQQEVAGQPYWQVQTESGPMEIGQRLNMLDWANKLPGAQWSPDELKEYSALKFANLYPAGTDFKKIISDNKEVAPDSMNWLEQNLDRLSVKQPGHLLEIHVLPEEREMLDWDQPMLAQHPDVQRKIVNLYASKTYDVDNPFRDMKDPDKTPQFPFAGNWTGEEIYKSFPGNIIGGNELASKAFHEAGIPGIKYLDAGSRHLPPDHPDVTRNYVIFDPSNLRIVSRDGQRLEPVDYDPFEEKPK